MRTSLLLTAALAGSMLLAASASASAPPGYTVVEVDQLRAPIGLQSHFSATCPAGTVPLDGGALVDAGAGRRAINSSFPTPTGWAFDINNGSAADAPVVVSVVCAAPPPGYVVRMSATVPNAAGTQSSAAVKCPAGTKPLGGGGLSSSSSLFINMNSTLPHRRQWVATENNATGLDASLIAFVVCGALPHYTVVTGRPFTIDPGGLESGLAFCPRRTVVIGGGIDSASPSLAVNTYFGLPNGDRWESGIDNETAFETTATTLAVCAGG